MSLSATSVSFHRLFRGMRLVAKPSSLLIHSNSISLPFAPTYAAHRSIFSAHPSRSSQACDQKPERSIMIIHYTSPANWAAVLPAESRALRTSLRRWRRRRIVLPDASRNPHLIVPLNCWWRYEAKCGANRSLLQRLPASLLRRMRMQSTNIRGKAPPPSREDRRLKDWQVSSCGGGSLARLCDR